MKTRLYFLEVKNVDVDMVQFIKLSKKEFERQLKYLRNCVDNTQNEEWCNRLEFRETIVERNNCIIKYSIFSNCSCDTILSEYICVDGFRCF